MDWKQHRDKFIISKDGVNFAVDKDQFKELERVVREINAFLYPEPKTIPEDLDVVGYISMEDGHYRYHEKHEQYGWNLEYHCNRFEELKNATHNKMVGDRNWKLPVAIKESPTTRDRWGMPTQEELKMLYEKYRQI